MSMALRGRRLFGVGRDSALGNSNAGTPSGTKSRVAAENVGTELCRMEQAPPFDLLYYTLREINSRQEGFWISIRIS
jgi:hypothetical protein